MAKEPARKKNPTFMSPKGTSVYPKLNAPDYGTEDFPKPDGEYSTKLRMSKEEAEAFVNKKVKQKDGSLVSLRDLHDQAMASAQEQFDELDKAAKKKLEQKKITEVTAHPLYQEVFDKETGDETGDVEFKFKKKASGTNKKTGKKWESRPDLFDAKGNKLGKNVNIWGGSTLKVNFEAAPFLVNGTWTAGVSLYLNAAQVIDLVTNGSRDASGYGFEQEEGYEYDPEDYREDDEEKSEGSSGDNTPADDEDDF